MKLAAYVPSLSDELVKIATELTDKSRSKIKTKSFALPEERRYPIHDEQHARSALGFVAMHGSAEEKARVHAAVAKKYPGLEKTAGWAERSPELFKYRLDSINDPKDRSEFRDKVLKNEQYMKEESPELMENIGRPLLEKSAETRDRLSTR